MANPFTSIVNAVGTLAAGHIVTALEWNAAVNEIYDYINSELVAVLNVMAAKGDIWVFDGANLKALAVGADAKVLVANSAAPNGIDWEALVNTTTLTTKGDLLGYDTNLARIPVGVDGQFLKADSTDPQGLSWGTPVGVPLGGIILWDLSQRAMPAGFSLCDGGTYNTYVTPNTQGLYLVGAGIGANPPAAGGMGTVASGTIAGDASAGTGLGPSHRHSVFLGLNGVTAGAASVYVGTLAGSLYTGANTITPRYGALAFIMRTS